MPLTVRGYTIDLETEGYGWLCSSFTPEPFGCHVYVVSHVRAAKAHVNHQGSVTAVRRMELARHIWC